MGWSRELEENPQTLELWDSFLWFPRSLPLFEFEVVAAVALLAPGGFVGPEIAMKIFVSREFAKKGTRYAVTVLTGPRSMLQSCSNVRNRLSSDLA